MNVSASSGSGISSCFSSCKTNVKLDLKKKNEKPLSEMNSDKLRIQKFKEEHSPAKRQAPKTMARANQMDSAHMEFTASIEYQEKEDEEDRAEELRRSFKEQIAM